MVDKTAKRQTCRQTGRWNRQGRSVKKADRGDRRIQGFRDSGIQMPKKAEETDKQTDKLVNQTG